MLPQWHETRESTAILQKSDYEHAKMGSIRSEATLCETDDCWAIRKTIVRLKKYVAKNHKEVRQQQLSGDYHELQSHTSWQ